MKKFFYLSAILAMVLVSCNSEKEYIAKLSNTASMIEKEADLSEAITLHYCDTWRKVIYDHEYNGEYCTDFNEALAKHQEFIITTDTYKRLKQKRDSIEAIMPQLNDYPSSCKDAYKYQYMQIQMNYSDSQMSLGALYLHTQQKQQTFIKR